MAVWAGLPADVPVTGVPAVAPRPQAPGLDGGHAAAQRHAADHAAANAPASA